MSSFDQFRQTSRENLHRIWEAVKAGQALGAEEQRLAEAMQGHPEYHNAWEFSDVMGPIEYAVDSVNPFLHITAHAIIEAQLESSDPPEVAQALHRLRRDGVDRHQAIHHIAAEFFEVLFPVLKDGKLFDRQRYRKRLRRLGRSPDPTR